MTACIEQSGNELVCRLVSHAGMHQQQFEGAAALAALDGWAARYNRAGCGVEEHAQIGHQMFAWLNERGWASTWVESAREVRTLRLCAESPQSPLGRALFAAPWELLADRHGFLADDAVHGFDVARCVGKLGEPASPRHSDLRVVFMCAAPEGSGPLSYAGENAAMVAATRHLPLHLVVEDSGGASGLTDQLASSACDVLHLSCLGNTDEGGEYLEWSGGYECPVRTRLGKVLECLGERSQYPSLVVLSVSRSVEQVTPPHAAEAIACGLLGAGVANALVWDGPVDWPDSIALTTAFYRALADGQDIAAAAVAARHQLRTRFRADPQRGDTHWHSARLYLGTHGGGALIEAGKPAHPSTIAHCTEGLPGRELIGRRGIFQAALVRLANCNGVLLHGMGGMGKSSLVARIANLARHHQQTVVVVSGSYDALSVFDRMAAALTPEDVARFQAAWRGRVAENPEVLQPALAAMFYGPLQRQSILLIVDGLECILETPSPEHRGATPMQAGYRATYIALLSAIALTRCEARLLVTSRYRFTLTDARGRDVVDWLACLQVPPMTWSEQLSQWSAQLRASNFAAQSLADRVLAAAKGNPGLLSALTACVLRGEAESGLAGVTRFYLDGAVPAAGNGSASFFASLGLAHYRAALSQQDSAALSAACLFADGLGVPQPAVEAAVVAAGVVESGPRLDRLLALGLLDDCGKLEGVQHLSVNALARPQVPPLQGTLAAQLASAVVPALHAALSHSHDRARVQELARLALLATSVDAAILDHAVVTAVRAAMSSDQDAQRALEQLLEPALARFDAWEVAPSSAFSNVLFSCAVRCGRMDLATRVVRDMLQSIRSSASPPLELADQWRMLAMYQEAVDPAAARDSYQRAADLFAALDRPAECVSVRSSIADLLQTRGELDEALRIRMEEQLPRSGGRSKVRVLEQIADILESRGELERAQQALEERLKTLQSLDEVRDVAITQGRIADVLQARGQLEESLRIRRAAVLPVLERLGDVQAVARTQIKVAEILQALCRFGDALRLLQEDVLPTCKRSADVRSQADVLERIAAIQRSRAP